MLVDECNIQQLVARLRTAHFQSYLLSHGWVETPSRYNDQRRFEADMGDGEGMYEMYSACRLPTLQSIKPHLLRNIYKLCGIEDREPAEIAREMVADRVEVESPDVQPSK